MATERSDKVYESYLEAAQKFDYFVVSVSLALVGYLGAQFQPTNLGWNASAIELATLASLLLSGIAGLKRIETMVTHLAFMHTRLHQEEAAGETTDAAISGRPVLNRSTGDILWPGQLLAKAQYYKMGAQTAAEWLEKVAERGGRWYRTRNFLLFLGLTLLIASRLVVAYIG